MGRRPQSVLGFVNHEKWNLDYAEAPRDRKEITQLEITYGLEYQNYNQLQHMGKTK